MAQKSIASFFSSSSKRTSSDELPAPKRVKEEPSQASKNESLKSEKLPQKPTPVQKNESPAPVQKNTSKSILYLSLCETFAEIESTSSRLAIIASLSAFFSKTLKTSPEDLIPCIYLLTNKLGPDYDNPELGLGESLLLKAIGESTGRTLANLRADYKKVGDLGLVTLQSKSRQSQMFKPSPLDVATVFKNLKSIATTTGANSQQRKVATIVRMLGLCSGVEAKFLVRLLEGKLRIGLAEKLVLAALAKALLRHDASNGLAVSAEDEAKAEQQIRVGFNMVSNYEMLVRSALEHGILNLEQHVHIIPGIPLKPMLAKPTKLISEILDKFLESGDFTCEYKYDGERAQIHVMESGDIHVYLRNLENMTERYPDLISAMKGFLKPGKLVSLLILDAEVVAWDREQEKILPFQVLTTRKRKAVKLEDVKVQICIFAFDCLLINGELLTEKTLAYRRELLFEYLNTTPGKFQFAVHKNLSDVAEIQSFLDESIKDSCEGLMVKLLSSTYEPSARSSNWLKLKKDYLSGVGDLMDLVVLGGYFGKGKRTGFYGGFLLGCYNPDSGEYETACKIGTGFSDEMLKQLYERLHKIESKDPKSYYQYGVEPDVWFEPQVVFEVLTADLSLSPVYKAGIGSYEKGISLRFPRFIRLREDKGPEDATSSTQMVEMYEAQAGRGD